MIRRPPRSRQPTLLPSTTMSGASSSLAKVSPISRITDAIDETWELKHKAPGAPSESYGTNVMPDLATAMKYNPRLKVMLNGGYFDLATPYFAARYEMSHLPIQASLRSEHPIRLVQVRAHGLRP